MNLPATGRVYQRPGLPMRLPLRQLANEALELVLTELVERLRKGKLAALSRTEKNMVVRIFAILQEREALQGAGVIAWDSMDDMERLEAWKRWKESQSSSAIPMN